MKEEGWNAPWKDSDWEVTKEGKMELSLVGQNEGKPVEMLEDANVVPQESKSPPRDDFSQKTSSISDHGRSPRKCFCGKFSL